MATQITPETDVKLPEPPVKGSTIVPEQETKPQDVITSWIDYRMAELKYENDTRAKSPLGAGNVNAGERQKVIAVMLDELGRMSIWLDTGAGEFVPPMSEESKKEWRFARDHGADVPAHILEQL